MLLLLLSTVGCLLAFHQGEGAAKLRAALLALGNARVISDLTLHDLAVSVAQTLVPIDGISILVIALIAVELASLGVFRNRLQHERLIDAPVWLALLIIAYLAAANRTTSFIWTTSGFAVVMFAVGLYLRHWTPLSARLFVQNRPRLLQRIPDGEDLFGTRQARRVGLCAELVGLSALAEHWLVLAGAALVGGTLTALAIGAGDKQDYNADVHPLVDHLGTHPHLGSCFKAVVASAALALLSGCISTELPIFWGNQSQATTLISTLAQIVGVVGGLGITIAFILAQVTASEISIRSSFALTSEKSFLLSLASVSVGLGFDVVLLARVGQLSSDLAGPSRAVDVAILLFVFAFGAIAWFLHEAPRLLAPEAIVARELKHFDTRWADIGHCAQRSGKGQPRRPDVPHSRPH